MIHDWYEALFCTMILFHVDHVHTIKHFVNGFLWKVCLEREPHIATLWASLAPWRLHIAGMGGSNSLSFLSEKAEYKDIMNWLENAVVL